MSGGNLDVLCVGASALGLQKVRCLATEHTGGVTECFLAAAAAYVSGKDLVVLCVGPFEAWVLGAPETVGEH